MILIQYHFLQESSNLQTGIIDNPMRLLHIQTSGQLRSLASQNIKEELHNTALACIFIVSQILRRTPELLLKRQQVCDRGTAELPLLQNTAFPAQIAPRGSKEAG